MNNLMIQIREKAAKVARHARENAEAGQDMIEYALIAGMVAVTAGATMAMSPTMSDSMQRLMTKIAKFVALAAGATTAASC